MQTLRSVQNLARFVLVWFAFSIGVAIASPLVHPQGMQLVCSAAGASKIVIGDASDKDDSALHLLDCPLCAGIGAPPPLDIMAFNAVKPRGYALLLQSCAPTALVASAPPPARGPPTLS